jgi:hypothetical protein
MRIDFARYGGLNNKNARHWRRARTLTTRGAKIRVNAPEAIDLCTALLPSATRKIDDDVQRAIYASFEALAYSDKTTILSAVQDAKLVGFLGIRALSSDYRYFTWSATAQNVSHISDLLYATAIEMYAGRGILDLGYGVNEGIFSYKRKWAPTDILPPRAYLEFSR